MADIRISELPLATGPTAPSGTDVVAIDGLTTRRTTITALGDIAVPVASQAESEAGVNAVKRMTPLTTKQSIASEVGGTIASAAQGELADSSAQPGDSVEQFIDGTNKKLLTLEERNKLNRITPVINSRDDGASIDVSLNLFVVVNKWNNSSLFAPARYANRGTSEPNHECKFISGGVWFELDEMSVSRRMFGAMCDWNGSTGTDDTLALQRMINYCNPFVWKGSVSATQAALASEARATITPDFGVSRVTSTIKINPYVSWKGASKGGFFYGKGTDIIADFNDPNGYVIDAAPYDQTGQRILGGEWTGNDFDNGLVTGCMGWVIERIGVSVAPGRKVKGLINRAVSTQSAVRDCNLDMRPGVAYEGVKTCCSWGGDVSRNQIVAAAVGYYGHTGVTVDFVSENYISILGTKPTTAEYQYPDFPEPSLVGKSVGIAGIYADLHTRSNVIERAQIAFMGARENFFIDDMNYYEGSDIEYIYAFHSVQAELSPKYIYAINAALIWAEGGLSSKYEIILNSCSQLDISSMGFVSPYVASPVLHGADDVFKRKTTDTNFIAFDNRFSVSDIDTGGVRTIYVSNLGNDDQWGYSEYAPVATLQEAIDRSGAGSLNRIKNVGSAIFTKNFYRNGDLSSGRKMEGLRLELLSNSPVTLTVGATSGENHTLPRGVSYFRAYNININCPSGTGDFSGFVAPLGSVNILLENVSMTNGVLVKPRPYDSGIANITMRVATLTQVLLTGCPSTSKLAWAEMSNDVTISGSSAGYTAGKIISSTF